MHSFTLDQYKTAWKEAFGPINKQKVLERASRDTGLSVAEAAALRAWVDRQLAREERRR